MSVDMFQDIDEFINCLVYLEKVYPNIVKLNATLFEGFYNSNFNWNDRVIKMARIL